MKIDINKELAKEEKAIYRLLTDRSVYEKKNYFVNLLLVHPEIIERFIDKKRIENYKVFSYKSEKIENFLRNSENQSEERWKNKELIILKCEEDEDINKIMASVPFYLRCESIYKSSRRWMINKEHWGKIHTELKPNLWDVTVDFTRLKGVILEEILKEEDNPKI